MTREEAGRKGGEKVASEKGPKYYKEIGKKGGEIRGSNKGSGTKPAEWGRMTRNAVSSAKLPVRKQVAKAAKHTQKKENKQISLLPHHCFY
jgi:hypothetical protein